MRNFIMCAAIASLLLAGCSKEKAPTGQTVTKELGVTAGISSSVATRAIIDGIAFNSNDQIAVFVAGGTGGTAYVPKLSLYTLAGTTWTAPAAYGDKIYLSDVEASVYGFVPVTAAVTAATLGVAASLDIALPVAETSFTGTAASQIDYMYAVPTYYSGFTKASNSNNAEKVILDFRHALSKVTFVINKGESYTGAGVLTSLKLSKNGGFNAGTGTMAINGGALTWGASINEVSFSGTTTINAFNAVASTVPTVIGLVAPRADNSSTWLTVVVDGKPMNVMLPVSLVTPFVGSTWIPGNNYRYTVNMNGTNLNILSVAITDWNAITVGTVEIQ